MKVKALHKSRVSKPTARPYLPEELQPQSVPESEAELASWLKRNRSALDRSYKAAREAYARGECEEVTSVEEFAAKLIAEGRRRRSRRAT